jgi:hypothetical protein
MSADSRTEQQDIEALLSTMEELEDISVLASYRGLTESDIDLALAGSLVRSGKKAGAVVLVLEPEEKADGASNVPLFARTHTVRVIEQVKVNNLQRLHQRYLGRAALVFSGSSQYADARGGIGYDVTFAIRGALGMETRAATPVVSAAGLTVTLTGAGYAGEVIYYTTDGKPPVPGGATVQTYSAPVTLAAAGDRIRAASVATGKALSNFISAIVTE